MVYWAPWSSVLETGEDQGKALTAAEDLFLQGVKLFTEHRGSALQLFKTSFLLSAPCGFMLQHHIVNCTYLQLQLNSWMQYCTHSRPLKPGKHQGILGILPFSLLQTAAPAAHWRIYGMASNHGTCNGGFRSWLSHPKACLHGGHVKCIFSESQHIGLQNPGAEPPCASNVRTYVTDGMIGTWGWKCVILKLYSLAGSTK